MNEINTVFVPERFRKAVILHIVCNLLAERIGDTPLLLGIHGPSGSGKTFQCEHVLREMGVETFYVAESELESEHAGRPAQILRAAYESAGTFIRSEKRKGQYGCAVLLINDIDTGLGNWGEMVQTTVNRQLVLGELMHLADYPEIVNNHSVERVPIIVTGNDFSKLYTPLLRPGRMRLFEWKPKVEELAVILMRVMPEYSENDCAHLVRQFPGEPLSFFIQLKGLVTEHLIWSQIASIPPKRVISTILNGINKIEPSMPSNIQLLIKEGKNLLLAGQLKSHLRVHHGID